MQHSQLGQERENVYNTAHLNFGISQRNNPLRFSLYLGEMQKLENTSLVSFEIWRVGLYIATANTCFAQNIKYCFICYFLRGILKKKKSLLAISKRQSLSVDPF